RLADWVQALRCYSRTSYPGARARHIRVLERSGQPQAAGEAALQALQHPESEAEDQALSRMVRRLQRMPRNGPTCTASVPAIDRIALCLPADPAVRVEEQVRAALERPGAPAFYVENSLIN